MKERHRLVVFPGGQCSKWDNDLDTRTLSIFRSHIETGGHAFMLCAGAYFAARKSVYNQKGSPPFERERLLKFFPGTVEGPLIPPPRVGHGSVWDLVTNIRWVDGSVGTVYIYGGGRLVPDPSMEEECEVLAEFCVDDSIAIAKCPVGKGTAILSSVHLEFDEIPSIITSKFADRSEAVAVGIALDESKAFRDACIQEIFDSSLPR
jgi:Uncharacterized conserved protein